MWEYKVEPSRVMNTDLSERLKLFCLLSLYLTNMFAQYQSMYTRITSWKEKDRERHNLRDVTLSDHKVKPVQRTFVWGGDISRNCLLWCICQRCTTPERTCYRGAILCHGFIWFLISSFIQESAVQSGDKRETWARIKLQFLTFFSSRWLENQ